MKKLLVFALLFSLVSQADTPPTVDVYKMKAPGGNGLIVSTSGKPALVQTTHSGWVATWNGTTVDFEAPGGGGGGTVSSVGLLLPSDIFTISGSPVTSTGTLTGSFATQAANQAFLGPVGGSPGTPAFRALVAADVPSIAASKITSGQGSLTTSTTGVTVSGTNAGLAPMTVDVATASNSQPGLISTGSQTLAGDKTLTGVLTSTNLTAEGIRSPATGSIFFGQLPLSSVGIHNTIAGSFAGSLLTSGFSNSFFGYNAGASAQATSYNTFMGDSAGGAVLTNSNVMIGAFATTSGGAGGSGAVQNNFIGAFSGGSTTGSNNQLMGANAGYSLTSGSGNILLGTNVGDGYLTTQSGNFIAGSDPWPITTVSFGNGKFNATPATYTLQGTGGLGTNVAGADLLIAGGAGTGSAIGGDVVLKTASAGSSGASPNASAERARVSTTGVAVTGQVSATTGVKLSTSGAQPTCDSAHRGLMWNVEGGAGVADIFQICQKDAADAYGWATH